MFLRQQLTTSSSSWIFYEANWTALGSPNTAMTTISLSYFNSSLAYSRAIGFYNTAYSTKFLLFWIVSEPKASISPSNSTFSNIKSRSFYKSEINSALWEFYLMTLFINLSCFKFVGPLL